MNAPATIKPAVETIRIRASALTMWPDCERRAAARLFPKMLLDQGFELRQTPIHIGAPIGTGTHAGAAYGMSFKMATGELPPLSEAEQVAISGLDEALDEVGGDVDWKPGQAANLNEAQKQVRRMLAVVHTRLSPLVKPAAVEDFLQADIGDGFALTGHRDLYGIEVKSGNWSIVDLKTGAHKGSHMPQTGAYAILGRSHGNQVDGARIFHVPRVPLKKTQPDPVIIDVPIESAERAAEATYKRAKSSLLQFMETGDPHVFLANPFSKLCGESCPAWGTPFCREHLEIE